MSSRVVGFVGTPQLSRRELETVLAALSYWQDDLGNAEEEENMDGSYLGIISEEYFQDENYPPLTVAEIDDLVDKLKKGLL